MLESGEIDMLSDVSYTKERAEKMLYPSYSMGTESYFLYIRSDQVDDFNEDVFYFNGKKIGVNKGSIQADIYRDWEKTHNISAELIELSCSEPESVDMLLDGTLDAYITLDNYLSIETVVPVTKIGYSDFYFAVNKSRTDLLNELDIALGKIQDKDRFYSQELYNKYIKNSGASLFLNFDEKHWLSEHSTIRVGYLDNYLAYCALDDDTKTLTGALKDYLEKASECFENGKFNFDTKAYSTVEKLLTALKKGDVDCIFPANISIFDSEKMEIILTPEIARAALYTVVSSSVKTDFINKKSVTAAVIKGDANYESIIKDLYPDWKTVTCDDIYGCIAAVSEGKADCFLISSYRYITISKLCEKNSLTFIDTGKDIPFCFAVNKENTKLFSILTKTTNLVPESYVNNVLTYYYSEETKTTLIDVIRDNIIIVIAGIIVFIAMIMLIIAQSRIIKAEKKAKETRNIADALSRRVYVDALTSVRNKSGYSDYIQTLQDRLEHGEVKELAVCMLDCDDLKYVNDKFGHDKGDEYLKTATRFICNIFQHSPVFRVGGDEFISILQNEDYQSRKELLERFESEGRAINEATNNDREKINVSLGLAEYDPEKDHSIEDTVSRADQKMYDNKRKRKAGRAVR